MTSAVAGLDSPKPRAWAKRDIPNSACSEYEDVPKRETQPEKIHPESRDQEGLLSMSESCANTANSMVFYYKYLLGHTLNSLDLSSRQLPESVAHLRDPSG